MERDDINLVREGIKTKKERANMKDVHPTYRPTCCGKKDFIINKDKLVYICRHCGTEYKLDIFRYIDEDD